ncbi:MAG: signal peptidase II [Chthonomonadales bacterium]
MKPIRFFLAAIIIILADQVTKWSVVRSIPLNQSRPALGKFMVLTYTQNSGGAFSLMQGNPYIFIIVAVVAISALIFAYVKYQQNNLPMSAALALALGGATGNLIDRLRYGYVVDFFDFHGGTDRNLFPIFNVADSAISVGIILLMGMLLFSKEPKKPEPEAVSDPGSVDTQTP